MGVFHSCACATIEKIRLLRRRINKWRQGRSVGLDYSLKKKRLALSSDGARYLVNMSLSRNPSIYTVRLNVGRDASPLSMMATARMIASAGSHTDGKTIQSIPYVLVCLVHVWDVSRLEDEWHFSTLKLNSLFEFSADSFHGEPGWSWSSYLTQKAFLISST